MPKREFGDGVDKYKDFIRPGEAQTREVYDAASLVKIIKLEIFLFDSDHPYSTPLKDRIDDAKSVLRYLGFESIRKDFVYWSPKFQKWRKLRNGVGQEFQNRWREASLLSGADFEKLQEWGIKYPWRSPLPIHQYVKEHCEPYSLIWCAYKILWDYESLRWSLQELLQRGSKMSRKKRRHGVLGPIKKAADIGTTTEMLRWKVLHEDAAILGFDFEARQGERAQEGGKSRKARAEEQRRILRELAFAPQNLRQFITKRDKQQVSFLKNLASNFDSESKGEPLFQQASKNLSQKWFEDRLSEWQVSGELDQAVEKLPKRQ